MSILFLVTVCFSQFLHLALWLRFHDCWSSTHFVMSSWNQRRCAILLLPAHEMLSRVSLTFRGWVESREPACVLFLPLLYGGAAPRGAVLPRAPCARPLAAAGELQLPVRRGLLWCLSIWDRGSGAGCVLFGREFGSMC